MHQCLLATMAGVGILAVGGSAFGADLEYRSVIVRVAPHLDVSATYDSNVYRNSEDTESDVYWQTQAGLNLGLIYKSLKLDAVGYTYSRTYSDTDPEENEKLSRGQRIDLSFGRRDLLEVRINEMIEHSTDYSLLAEPTTADVARPGQTPENQVDWSDRTPRDIWRMGVMLGRDLTDKTEGDVGYTYTKTDYVMDNLNDSERNAGQLILGYKVTDKSALLLDGRYAVENSDGYEGHGSDAYIGPGFKTRMTEKVEFMGSVGYEAYRSGTLNGTEKKNDVDAVGLHMTGSWRPVDKLVFRLTGDRLIEASVIDSNAREVTLFGVTTGYRLTDALTASLMFSYRWDEYQEPPDGGTTERSMESQGTSFVMDYKVGRCLTLYGATTYQTSQSNLTGDDFDQFRATLGARAAF